MGAKLRRDVSHLLGTVRRRGLSWLGLLLKSVAIGTHLDVRALGRSRVERHLLVAPHVVKHGDRRRRRDRRWDGRSRTKVVVGRDVLALVVLLILLIDLFLVVFQLLLVFITVTRCTHSGRHRTRAVHLLAGREVDLRELLDVVPPLHHLVVAASTERVGHIRAEHVGLLASAALNVELVRRGSGRRGSAQRALRQEERELRHRVADRVRRAVLVEVAGRRQHVERLLVSIREALLALEHALVHRNDRGILLAWVVDRLGVAQRRVRVEQVVRARGKGDPLSVGLQAAHVHTETEPGVLDLSRHAAAPFVKGLPGALDAAHNGLFKVSRVLLHNNDALLQSILLIDLALELDRHSLVGRVRVVTGAHAHRRVLQQRDRAGEVRDHLRRHLTLTSHHVGQLARVLLHVGNVRLDLLAQLVQVLDNRAFDRLGKVSVVVRNGAGLLANAVEDVLETVLAEELVALAEWHLDNATKLGHFLGRVVLNISDALKVRDEHFDNILPACTGLAPRHAERR